MSRDRENGVGIMVKFLESSRIRCMRFNVLQNIERAVHVAFSQMVQSAMAQIGSVKENRSYYVRALQVL